MAAPRPRSARKHPISRPTPPASAPRYELRNADVARALRELALRLELEDVPFKPQALERAAHSIEAYPASVAELYAREGLRGLQSVPTVGKGIAERIAELLTDGAIAELSRMRIDVPCDILALTSIPGVGPKAVKALHESLGVRTVDDLERAARAGKVHEVTRFGEKSEQNILRNIELYRRSSGRLPLGAVLELARTIEERLRRVPGVRRAQIAGSVRRYKETIGDLDFVASSARPEAVMDAFVAMPDVAAVDARGPTKATVRLHLGIDADLRVVPEESFGAALAYFTGSKDHNVAMRRIAQEKGLKLNEYGLFRGDHALSGATEEDVYEALGLSFVPPEMREDRGEIELARAHRLPRLIDHGDLRGDLQIQTRWTDGKATIEEMALEARRLGLEYIAITDHTRDLPMSGGCDEEKLLREVAEVREVDLRLDGIRVLAGAEVNIRKDGSLDIADEVLAQLDVVGAALHSHFHLGRDETTRRLVRAMENPHVDILFHPTSRALGRRPPVDLDFDAIVEAAKRTGTALEIDAHPARLDLRDEDARRAVSAGAKLVIDSDAHSTAEIRFGDELGVAVARRGWVRAGDVLNTLPLADFFACLKDGRARPAKRASGSRR